MTTLTTGRRSTPARERFLAKIDTTGGPDACWPWTAALFTQTGYGVFHPVKGKTVSAHTWSYREFIGPIPDGLHVDHTCHNRDQDCPGGRACVHRSCVNPAHLEPVDPDANVKRSPRSNHRKTHCPRQHEYTPENTYIRHTATGDQRICRECAREADRRRSGNRKRVI